MLAFLRCRHFFTNKQEGKRKKKKIYTGRTKLQQEKKCNKPRLNEV